MTFAVLVLLLVMCEVLNMAVSYDYAADKKPDSLLHRAIRRLSRWMSSGGGQSHT